MIKNSVKRRFKKAISLALILVMTSAFIIPVNAESSLTLNCEQADLYVLDEDYKEAMGEMPSEYPASVQLEANTSSDDVYWYVSKGNSVQVDQNGLVTPCTKTWYWYNGFGTTTPPAQGEEPTKVVVEHITGESTVTCVANGVKASAVINVIDYSDIYVDNCIQEYIDANINDSMTNYEKLEKVCRYVADFEYSVYYSAYKPMVIYGGGDCWASAGLIAYMCNEFLGIDAAIRYGVNDPGAGSGHRNTVVNIDGKFYAAEAGFSMAAPRYYEISELTDGFSFSRNQSGYTVYQYDGRKSDVVIPATYNDNPVTEIDGAVFFYNDWEDFVPVSVSIPDSVTSISSFAFSDIDSIQNFYVDENNSTYRSSDGVIYSKDKTELVSCPSGKEGVLTIDEGTDIVGEYSVYCASKVTEVIVPEGVTHIKEGAFGDCSALSKVVLPESLQIIDTFAFYNDRNLTKIYIPQSVTEIGDNVFSNTDSITIYGEEGSYAQEYAQSNGIKFVAGADIDATDATETNATEPTETTTTSESSSTAATDANEIIPTTTDSAETTPTESEPAASTSTDATEAPAHSTAAAVTVTLGDADSDGSVKVKDATAIQKYAAELISLTAEQLLAADVNADSRTNIKDATAIQKWLANITVDYPIGETLSI